MRRKSTPLNPPLLALPFGTGGFEVCCDTSRIGLGCVLMQLGRVIAYASLPFLTLPVMSPILVRFEQLERGPDWFGTGMD